MAVNDSDSFVPTVTGTMEDIGGINSSDLGYMSDVNYSDAVQLAMSEVNILPKSIPLRHSLWTIVLLVAAYTPVFIVGLVGNVFVVVIVLRTPKMRTVTNYFILNLALADLLVLIVCLPPTLVSNIFVPWVMGWLLCKAVPYIQGVAVCASVYSLVAISADRFLGIWFPLRRQITKKVARRIIVLIWMWATGLALPWLLYFDLSNADEKSPSLVFCVETWPVGMDGNVYFVVVNLVLLYLFPLGLISFCYCGIWLRVWHRHLPKDKDSTVSHCVELIHQRAKASVIKMVIVVVAVFAASWLPLYIIFVRIKLIPTSLSDFEESALDLALPIAQWLGASNSCINPVLYAFFNSKFRCAFCALLHCGSWRSSKALEQSYYSHHHHHQKQVQPTDNNKAREKKSSKNVSSLKFSTAVQGQVAITNFHHVRLPQEVLMLRQPQVPGPVVRHANNTA